MGGVDLAQAAALGHFKAEDEVCLAQALGAGLVDAVVTAGGFDHGLALGDGHRGRFFRVHVLAVAHGQHGHVGVEPVAGGAQDRVNVRARGEELDRVGVHLAVVVAVAVVHHPLDGLAPLAVRVARGHEDHVRLAQHPVEHAGAAVADADAAEHDFLAGRHRAVAAEHGGGDEQGQRGGRAGRDHALQELAPVQSRRAPGFGRAPGPVRARRGRVC
jgi:hypothetical protein